MQDATRQDGMRGWPERLRGALVAWATATGGVAAVEFALVLPIMIAMLLGVSEVTLGVNQDRKLTLLSRALADLSSRSGSLTAAQMANVFGAASAIMRPYDTTQLQMVVTSITVTKAGSTYVGNVAWSCGQNAAAGVTATQSDPTKLQRRLIASLYTVPDGFQSDTTKSFIVAETLLPYKPTFGYVATGTIYMHENTPWPVRDTDQVTGPTACYLPT